MSTDAVLDTGEKDLPAVLCLHSLFLDPRMFDGFAEAATGHFRVIRPAFRGQADTVDDVDEPVTMDQCTDDMIALIEELDLAPVRIVAQSMGGDVAVRIAARRPELVASMALLGSSARGETQENLDAFTPLVDAIERQGFVGEILETTMGIMFGETIRSDPDRAEIVDLWRGRIAALSPKLAHAIRGVIQRPSALGLLGAIRAPTLVVSGTEDVARPPAWADEVVAGIDGAELWRLERVGHSPILEVPDTVTPRVLEFIARG